MTPTPQQIEWQLKTFNQLTAQEMHDLLRLRQDIFVVEQNCVYADIDGTDHEWLHLLGTVPHPTHKHSNTLIAYARLRFTTAASEPVARIGRVVVAPAGRGQELGRALMERAMAAIHSQYPNRTIVLGAQVYLLKFYQSLGFKNVGPEYLEDGILHQDMEWRGASA